MHCPCFRGIAATYNCTATLPFPKQRNLEAFSKAYVCLSQSKESFSKANFDFKGLEINYSTWFFEGKNQREKTEVSRAKFKKEIKKKSNNLLLKASENTPHSWHFSPTCQGMCSKFLWTCRVLKLLQPFPKLLCNLFQSCCKLAQEMSSQGFNLFQS